MLHAIRSILSERACIDRNGKSCLETVGGVASPRGAFMTFYAGREEAMTVPGEETELPTWRAGIHRIDVRGLAPRA